MRPAVTVSSPAIMRRVVVLPQPDGPSSATSSPGSMSRSIPFTASNGSRPRRGVRLAQLLQRAAAVTCAGATRWPSPGTSERAGAGLSGVAEPSRAVSVLAGAAANTWTRYQSTAKPTSIALPHPLVGSSPR